MVKTFAGAALALAGLGLATPAAALERDVVIEHPVGPIAADYRGAVGIEKVQIGSPGAPGRPNSLRCQWTAELSVERVARVGQALQTRRTMAQENVASGSAPGWCAAQAKAIDRMVADQRGAIEAVLAELVAQDRQQLLAEADSARANREG